MSGFVQRKISLTFDLGQGDFGESGFDRVKVEGLRCSAAISKTGALSLSYLQLNVYGLSQSMLNQLSTLGKPLLSQVRFNQITVEAGDDESGMSIVFIGNINQAYGDYSGAPDTALVVVATSGGLMAVKPVLPISFSGTADVATIISGIATRAGFTFENYGVTSKLSNPYFAGTGFTQLERCAEAAKINWIVDDGVIAIWPRGGSRGGAIPVVSPKTNLVGYPIYAESGPSFTVRYTPNIIPGGKIDVQDSSVIPANGTWYVFGVNHNLESEMPGGAWFTEVDCMSLGHVAG